MIHVITGPMKSGKSNLLIQSLEEMKELGYLIKAYKPSLDSRSTTIKSRTGREIECEKIDGEDLTSFSNEVCEIIDLSVNANRKIVVAIDEFQFISDDIIIDYLESLDLADVEIILSGLNYSSEKRPFGLMPNVQALCDNITELVARCGVCGSDATLTKANFNKEELVTIGDSSYMPVCTECYSY